MHHPIGQAKELLKNTSTLFTSYKRVIFERRDIL